MTKIIVIGGGLAGVEAAYQVAKQGLEVELYEMRPRGKTEAHLSENLGEMVCSNSLGSVELSSALGLLKEELQLLDSFVLQVANRARVPAGRSFAVDRVKLAEEITREIISMPKVTLIRRELEDIPENDTPVIVATGPLTSNALANNLTRITLRKNLFFYDATSPIIAADSIDFDKVFFASRYDKGEADFLNIPLEEKQYLEFVTDLLDAEKVELKEFERKIFFEACLPIEELASRGEKSLAYGPLKPVGLLDPHTQQMPHAVVQLRQDDLMKHFYQMVGFQTRLKWGEQKRIFRKLPGLEKAKFERYGRIHRNTYINAPLLINKFFQSKQRNNVFFAGQICGVEGYVESIGSGLLAGLFAAKKVLNETLYSLPEDSAHGALINYISKANWKDFKPTKFTFGLLPEIGKFKGSKRKVKEKKAEIALDHLKRWIGKANI